MFSVQSLCIEELTWGNWGRARKTSRKWPEKAFMSFSKTKGSKKFFRRCFLILFVAGWNIIMRI